MDQSSGVARVVREGHVPPGARDTTPTLGGAKVRIMTLVTHV